MSYLASVIFPGNAQFGQDDEHQTLVLRVAGLSKISVVEGLQDRFGVSKEVWDPPNLGKHKARRYPWQWRDGKQPVYSWAEISRSISWSRFDMPKLGKKWKQAESICCALPNRSSWVMGFGNRF